MDTKKLKQYLPYFLALVVFIVISFIYFKPLFDNKTIKQGDIINYSGAAKEINDYRAQYGEEPLWSNSMFGGMPAYQTSVHYKGNFVKQIDNLFQLWLPHPAGVLFLMFAGFFLLLLVLKVDPWLAIAGSIAFAFSTYFFIIIEAGHNSKAHAIAYMAPVLAGVILCLQKKYLTGGALTALFLSLEISTNHLQITYYLMLAIVILIITEAIYSITEKRIQSFLKSCGVLAIAAILAVLPNANNLLVTYDYGKYTTRGKSELTSDTENKTSGLDKDYATQWSYGKAETFSLIIPNIKGGASGLIAGNKTAMSSVDPRYKRILAENQINQYWGDQPFTSGPVYAGAFVVFLFILGLFIVKGKYKWFLLIATILSILLAWGKNFMGLTDLFLDYIPGYNKFRAVSMILVVAQLCIPLLAILTLKDIFTNPKILKEKKNSLYISFGLTGGLSLLFWLMPTTFFNFLSSVEMDGFAKQSGEGMQEFISTIETARIAIFKADVIRSFLFITVGAVILWLWSNTKFPKTAFLIILPLIFLFDMMPVCKRYLNDSNFVNKKVMANPFVASKADEAILMDKNPDFRVYNMAVNTFNDASTSYFHKSIGGYHGAKLKRYQEFIDNVLFKEITAFHTTLTSKPTDSSINATLAGLNGINLLNTRYIIYNSDAMPLINTHALGNAWFAKEAKIVSNADEEIKAVAEISPKNTAIIDKRFENQLTDFKGGTDSLAKIELISYKPNHLTYKTENITTPQLAVFSEIYYEKGWNAYIDNKLVPHFRTDYILRGMVIPAGTKNIEFKFEPKIYYTGEKISYAGSALLYLILIGAFVYEIIQRRRTINK